MDNSQPNLVLHGTTWDAQHMDKLIRSPIGQKLFLKGQSHAALQMKQQQARTFMNRFSTPVKAELGVAKRQTVSTDRIREGLIPLTQQLHAVSARIAAERSKLSNLLPPQERRRVTEQIVQLYKNYAEVQQNRFVILRADRLQLYYNKPVKVDPGIEQRRTRKAYAGLGEFTGSSASLEFGPTRSKSHETPRKTGPRRADEQSVHYRDTHESLFGGEPPRPRRSNCSAILPKYRRECNIISGANN